MLFRSREVSKRPGTVETSPVPYGYQQGCYRRVTNVRGLGGSTYEVSEPYQQNSKIDDWVFGEQRDPNNKVKPYTPRD